MPDDVKETMKEMAIKMWGENTHMMEPAPIPQASDLNLFNPPKDKTGLLMLGSGLMVVKDRKDVPNGVAAYVGKEDGVLGPFLTRSEGGEVTLTRPDITYHLSEKLSPDGYVMCVGQPVRNTKLDALLASMK